MSPTTQGAIVLVVTVLVFMTGAPVAFALGAVGIAFLVIFQGVSSLGVAAETLYSGLHDFTLVSIPMFVMMGAAIGWPGRRRCGRPVAARAGDRLAQPNR